LKGEKTMTTGMIQAAILSLILALAGAGGATTLQASAGNNETLMCDAAPTRKSATPTCVPWWLC
jgi:hypothetical protein